MLFNNQLNMVIFKLTFVVYTIIHIYSKSRMKMMHRFLVIMGKVMTFGRLEGPPLPAVYVKIISNLSLIITTTFDLSFVLLSSDGQPGRVQERGEPLTLRPHLQIQVRDFLLITEQLNFSLTNILNLSQFFGNLWLFVRTC